MYVIEVIPLNVGGSVETLSYYSSVPYDRGSIITIPIRSRDTDGVVMSVAPVSTLKTALRAATFTLRKLPPQMIVGHLSDTFLSLVDTIALERALHSTEVLTALVTKRRHLMSKQSDGKSGGGAYKVELFVAPFTERLDEYKRVVREAFAKGHSVLYVSPTIRGVEIASRELSPGIEKYVVTLQHEKKAAARNDHASPFFDEHPVLIIATPTFAYLERNDISTVIIESSRSKGYRSIRKPYLDYVHAIMTHARLALRTVILGDLVPHTEHIEGLRERRYTAHGEHLKRINLPGKLIVVHQKKDHDGTIPFTLFSPEMLSGIESVMRKKGRVFLLSARRGLAPVVGCADCGHIFRDPESGAPLSLHRAQKDGIEERWLVSTTSGHRTAMRDVCPSCGGWRLRERGIGIQHVETELKKALPNIGISLFDHTTATTDGKAKKISDIFYGIGSQVMLGTALALPYLDKPIDASGIVSMDSLLSIPSWRQQEEVFATLITLREKTKGPIWAQTRHRPDDRVLELAAHGELSVFYDEEIEARRTYSYPPFSSFILLSYQGVKNVVENTEAMLTALFSQYGIVLYGLPPTDDGHILRRGLLRFPRESWPNEQVVEALRSLPPSIKIEFDPERIV